MKLGERRAVGNFQQRELWSWDETFIFRIWSILGVKLWACVHKSLYPDLGHQSKNLQQPHDIKYWTSKNSLQLFKFDKKFESITFSLMTVSEDLKHSNFRLDNVSSVSQQPAQNSVCTLANSIGRWAWLSACPAPLWYSQVILQCKDPELTNMEWWPDFCPNN